VPGPARPRAVGSGDALPYGSAGTRLRPGLRSHRTVSDQRRAIGSAGERLVHTEEVTGSIPVSPTRSGPYADLSKDHCGSHSCSGPHDIQQRATCLAAQPRAELLERIAGGGRGYLGVDLRRDGDLAVPQDLIATCGCTSKAASRDPLRLKCGTAQRIACAACSAFTAKVALQSSGVESSSPPPAEPSALATSRSSPPSCSAA
jgi:hypothetical protein